MRCGKVGHPKGGLFPLLLPSSHCHLMWSGIRSHMTGGPGMITWANTPALTNIVVFSTSFSPAITSRSGKRRDAVHLK
jgi:hypothetical protein